ncbi:MAG: DUF448 domain-containing protein [Actinobacteria bacterium]|nr:DUF448 domain-containing protein [Actinomycetota bacterium]
MTPLRTCVVCRATKPAGELVRVGCDVGRSWYLGTGNGRGAWWCRTGECRRDVPAGRLVRALRRPISSTDSEAIASLLNGEHLDSSGVVRD